MTVSLDIIVFAGFVASAAGLCAVVAVEGARMTSRRYRLAWTDPIQLADAPKYSPLTTTLVPLAGVVVAALAVLLLAPVSPVWRTGVASSLLLFAEGMIAASAVLLHLRRQWSLLSAGAGCLLLTVGVCGLLRVLLGSAGAATSHYVVLLFACTIMAALWSWLAEVWNQQLDNGNAWTVAGRLIPFMRHFAAGNLIIAVVCAFAVARAVSTWGIIGHVLLLAVIVGCWRRFRGVTFAILLIAAGISMLSHLMPPASS
ncbi:MAG: hypothetical protein H6817_03095 [Phycisphaerales bacterium]|nr:hypothetical protein [Phycisphaerales bacterium]